MSSGGLGYAWMCVCRFHTGFGVLGEGTPKFSVSVDMEGVYSTQQLRELGSMLPQNCFFLFVFCFNRCSEINSGAFWGY